MPRPFGARQSDAAPTQPARFPAALLGFAGDALLLGLLTAALAFAALAPLLALRVDLDAHLLAMMALSFVAMGVAAWPLWRRSRRHPAVQPTLALRPSLGLAVAIGLATFAVNALRGWLEPQLVGDVPEPSNVAPILAALASQPWLAMAVFVLLGPWVEELLLRRVLLGRMLVRGWPWLGVLLTTSMFAWLHEPLPRADLTTGQWLWLLSGYWLMGALFAWLYWRTRRLSAAFAAHAINNALACGVLVITPG